MLFKSPRLVLQDLSKIVNFPSPKVFGESIQFRLPQSLIDYVCFLAGTACRTGVVRDLGHWHEYQVGVPYHMSCGLPRVQIEPSIKLLKRISHNKELLKGSVLLSAYAKVSRYFVNRPSIDFNCDDAEWEALLTRVMCDFDVSGGERKLVVRRHSWGRVEAATPHHLYAMEAYTDSASTWKNISYLPAAMIRLAPASERANLISRLVTTSLTVNPSDEHATDQLARLSEYVYDGFCEYLSTLVKKPRRETVQERRLVRKILSPRAVVKNLLNMKKHRSVKEAIEMSVLRDRYQLNPIKTAKFPREVIQQLFFVSRSVDVPPELIEETVKFLENLVGKKIKVSRINLVHLDPGLFELAKELCGAPDKFSSSETTTMIRTNSRLFVHLIKSEQTKMLDIDFSKCHESIAEALTGYLRAMGNTNYSSRKRKAYLHRGKILLDYFTGLCKKEMFFLEDSALKK